MNNTSVGSEWKKWDLHFHTPSSYDYSDGSVTNEQIVKTLKENDIKGVVVTDHLTIDVSRIQELQKIAGKDLVFFPGIELCTDSRGEDPIHITAVFPEDSDLSYIWKELEVKLKIATQLKDGKNINELYCFLPEASKEIRALGGLVLIHAGSKSNSIEEINNSLPVKMAEKKGIAQHTDIFEIGQEKDASEYREKVFPSIKKVYPMVICSDNHNVNKYSVKQNLWIKANVTFEGLKQILYEPDDRIFIGEEPPVLERVRNNKTKYLSSLMINQNPDYNETQGVWFKDVHIKLNKELIAIIGNKGSCKSAISDIIGVLSDTHNAGNKHVNLSFLNGTIPKFRKKGYAENFHAELGWEDGSGKGIKVPLNKDVNANQVEKVKYLPQNYFENLTNDLDGKGFDRTLKSVIFLHIPEEQRLGAYEFKELEEIKARTIEIELGDLREDIHRLSAEIISIEAKKHPRYRQQIESSIVIKQKEFDEHEKNKPKEVTDPSKTQNPEVTKLKEEKYAELATFNSQSQALVILAEEKRELLNKLVKEKEELDQFLSELERLVKTFQDFKDGNEKMLSEHGLSIDDILRIKLDKEVLIKKIETKAEEIREVQIVFKTKSDIDSDHELKDNEEKRNKALELSLNIQQEELEVKIKAIKEMLTQPEKDFQEYQEKVSKWDIKKKEIEGSGTKINTLLFFKEEKEYIDTFLLSELETKRKDRTEKAADILKKKKEIIELYVAFKKSVDQEISKDAEFTKKFGMEIDVNFKLDSEFAKSFLQFINKTKRGSFLGATEAYVNALFQERNLLDTEDITEILNKIIGMLEVDQREIDEPSKDREISDQIDKIQEFYDFVFSLGYLKPIYELKLDGKILDELSPGEKGSLLLVFYLMIDKEDIPLIIDQPEDNLDNKSVFQILTHFIKSAKKRRQIIIVTHNPNLAVGADAEQIIYVELDKRKNKNIFSYETGAIEEAHINKRIVEILEGTMPAFDKRRLRYMK